LELAVLGGLGNLCVGRHTKPVRCKEPRRRKADGKFALSSQLQTFGISQLITTAGPEESVMYLTERFHLPADQIIRYQGRSRKDLAAEAIEKNGGRLFTKLLGFAGGEMKRLCFDLVAFDGEIVSTVEEVDPFAVPLWHG
jgi:hypothetical protein